MKKFSRRFRKKAARGFLDAPLPRIFAHKGLALVHPENTIEAFQHALAQGCEYLETDIQVTRDGVPVLFHDSSLKPLMGISGRVKNILNSTLASYHFRTGEVVPTLEEALRLLPNAKFNLDVKASGAAVEIAKNIIEHQAQQRVLLSSFSRRRRDDVYRALQHLSPDNLPVRSASQGEFIYAFIAIHLRQFWLAKRILRHLQAVQIPSKVGFIRLDRKSIIARFHNIGVEVHYWTINSPEEMNRLVQLGADGIITDRPDLYKTN